MGESPRDRPGLYWIKNEKIQGTLLRTILAEGLNARQIEELTKRYKGDVEKSSGVKKVQGTDKYSAELVKKLETQFQTRVEMRHNTKTGKGKITFEYFSLDDLENLLKEFGIKKS